MITLNLLPEQEKKQIQKWNLFLEIKNSLSLLLLGTAVSAIMMFIGKFTLLQFLTKITPQDDIPIIHERNEITQLNKTLKRVKSIQDEYIPWTIIITQLSTRINQDIAISRLEIHNDGRMTLNGIAKTRESLLRLQEDLQKSGYVEPFDLPYDILFERENIPFTLSLQIPSFEVFLPDNQKDSPL